MYLAAPGIAFTGDPDDADGTWTVRVSLRDNLSKAVLPLKTSFTLKRVPVNLRHHNAMMSRFQRVIALVTGLLGPQLGHAAAISSHELARPEDVRHYLVMQPEGLPATQRPVVILLHGHGSRLTWGTDPTQYQVELLRIDGGGHITSSRSEDINWFLRKLVGDMNHDEDTPAAAWRFFEHKRAQSAAR